MLDLARRPVGTERAEPVAAPDPSGDRPADTDRPHGFPTAMLLATVATLAGALLWQLLTYAHGGHSSLSDLPRVFLHRDVGSGGLPYIDRVLEYPVGAGLLLYLAASIAPSPLGVLVVTAIGASVLAVAVTVVLERRCGTRTWRWVLGAPLLLFAFQNWDLFAVAALVGGLLAFERGRPAPAGVLLGVGTAVKLFPVVALPVLVAVCLTRRDRRAAVRLVVAATATWLLVNLPFVLANARGWWWTFRFQSARPATWGSVWLYGYRALGLPVHGAGAVHLANAVSMATLTAGMVALVVVTVRRHLTAVAAVSAAVALFVLTNKVYSPTYDLWLVPIFVLLPLRRRLWLAFCAVDLAIYATVYGYFLGAHDLGLVHTVLPALVLARTAVLLAVVVQAVRIGTPAPSAERGAPSIERGAPSAERIVPRARPWSGAVDRHRPLAGRLLRCMSVSVITTVLSLVSLVVLTAAVGMSPVLANVLTTGLATIPSYFLNRRWTWNRQGASDPWREVAPFWAMSFAGLALSTVTVGITATWAAHAHLVGVPRTAAVLAGHLAGFGILWVAQFVVLDRFVFVPHHHDADGPLRPSITP